MYFTPDATSQGLVTATIHLPCGFTEIKTFNLSRPVTAPTFTQTSVQSCTSTASMSINPTCGAIDYTYSIAGDQGVTFTNSQQIYTTTSTTVALTLPTGASVNSVKAKANYAGSISSTEGNSTLVVGAPQPGTINLQLIDPTFGRIHATIEAVPGAVSYNWYKNSSLVSGYNGTFATIPISRTACDLEYDIAVEAVSSNCGTSTQSHANAYVPCDNYSMSPNPASTSVTIESANSASQSASKSASPTKNAINKVWIMDKMGNVIQQYSYPDLQKVTINISGLKADTYVVKVFNGTNWTSKQLSVLK